MLPVEGKGSDYNRRDERDRGLHHEVFVANGVKVVIAGRRQDRGEKLARKLGDAASFIRADVSVEADVKAMVDHAADRLGRLDCLTNNAGRSSQYAAIADVDLVSPFVPLPASRETRQQSIRRALTRQM
jgi:NAD(P)-dependent dehydrogenase (short-subunit alcohol dehydrogenase family)